MANNSMNATTNARRAGSDHRFFALAAVGVLAIVIIGFARSYYLKTLFGTPVLPLLLHLHGALMTSWVVLFFTQTWLIASHRASMHMRLGALGAVLAVSMVMVVVAVLVHAAARDVHDPASGPRSILFLGTGLVNIAIFSTLVSTAITLRRRGDFHKRLMLLATLTILVAAIARIPLAFIERDGLSAAILLTDLCIIVVIAIDTLRHRRLHPAFVWGAALFMVSMHLANIGARTEAWARFAAWLVS